MFSAAAVGSVPATRMGTVLSTAIPFRHPFSSGWAAAPTSICKAPPGCYLTPEGSQNPGGFASQVSQTRLFPGSSSLWPSLGRNSSSSAQGGGQAGTQQSPVTRTVGSAVAKGLREYPTQYSSLTGAGGVCRAPGWWHRCLVGASRHEWGQTAAAPHFTPCLQKCLFPFFGACGLNLAGSWAGG